MMGPVRLRWLGQSGFLVEAGGRHLLIDPYLSDSLTRKYANTDKPHIRMTPIVADPASLTAIDVVTSSHSHTDHLDPDTLRPLAQANPGLQIVAPEPTRELVRERSGLDPIGLRDGESVEIAGFRIHAVPAAHEQLDPAYLGYVIQAAGVHIYHSGDTVLYPGMAERLRPFNIDIALLPINGRAPERRVAGNLWGREAAQLARDIGARLTVPMHYDMFTFNTATPDEFCAEAELLGIGYVVLRPGEWFRYPCE